jgi:hypothetical protein
MLSAQPPNARRDSGKIDSSGGLLSGFVSAVEKGSFLVAYQRGHAWQGILDLAQRDRSRGLRYTSGSLASPVELA